MLQKQVAQSGVKQPARRADLEREDIWHMQAGVRNKYFSQILQEKQEGKVNNRPKPTPVIDQALKIPNFVKSGSYVGFALQARNL